MQAEDLKGWLAAARQGEKERETATKDGGGGGEQKCRTEAEGHWERVVELIQTAFWDGDLAEEANLLVAS